jgi:hypothetical protein
VGLRFSKYTGGSVDLFWRPLVSHLSYRGKIRYSNIFSIQAFLNYEHVFRRKSSSVANIVLAVLSWLKPISCPTIYRPAASLAYVGPAPTVSILSVQLLTARGLFK